MSIPVAVEAWQTDTPDMPGSWRRTAQAVTSVENDTYKLVKCPVLMVEPVTSHLRVMWRKNGEKQWYVCRLGPLEQGKEWPPFTLTQEVVDNGVLYVEDRGAQLVMRIPIPRKPLLQVAPEPPSRPTSVSDSLQRMEEGVMGAAGLDAEVRSTAMELLAGFRLNLAPSLEDLDNKVKEVQRLTGDSNTRMTLPTYEGVDEKGRAHFRFRSPTSSIDVFVGSSRAIEIVTRSEFQLPDKAQLTPEMLMGAAFSGPVGEA